MPSFAQPPVGSVPAASVRNDVKATESSSDLDTQTAAKPQAEASESPKTANQASEPEVEESDLEALADQKKVPYQRFKDKVNESKELKERLAAMEREQQRAIQRAVEDAELRTKARLEREREEASALEQLDPVERRIQSTDREMNQMRQQLAQLQQQNDHQATQALLTRLQQKYPEADDLAVLGWAKARGVKATQEDAFEELMAASHNRNIEQSEKRLRQILEHKKQKAKAATPTREGGIRLKDGERPKNLKEAAALTKRFMSGDG